MVENYCVRPLERDNVNEVNLVAERMRLTLVEVLGYETAVQMYSIDWLRDRVQWHLDPQRCTGEVFVAEADGCVVGHTIVRLETDPDGQQIGLFSTIYVEPSARRCAIAAALLVHGQDWLIGHDMRSLATNTSDANEPLIALFEKHGYSITCTVPESRMVRLQRRV